MSLAILFYFLCAQHVSDINLSIIRSLRLFCWITTLVVLFLVRCVLEFRCGWVGVVSVLQAEARKHNCTSACNTDNTPAYLPAHGQICCHTVIICVYCCFYFRCRTAGQKSVFGRSCDRPSRHRFFLVSLCLKANAEMVPKIPSSHYMFLI